MSKDEAEFLKHGHEMTFKPKLALKNNNNHQKDNKQKNAAEKRQEINHITADVNSQNDDELVGNESKTMKKSDNVTKNGSSQNDSCSEIAVCETSLNSQSPESLKNQPAQNNHKKVKLNLDVNLKNQKKNVQKLAKINKIKNQWQFFLKNANFLKNA